MKETDVLLPRLPLNLIYCIHSPSHMGSFASLPTSFSILRSPRFSSTPVAYSPPLLGDIPQGKCFIILKKKYRSRQWCYTPPEAEGGESEFKASLLYMVSSKTTRVTQASPVSKHQTRPNKTFRSPIARYLDYFHVCI